MQRLTGLDATFLYLETPEQHMHTGGVFVFDPSEQPETYRPYEAVRSVLESRIHLLAPFRRRLVQVPFALHHPIWIEDPDFDLDYHLRRAALPSPGGEKELAELASEIMGRQLDRNHPLWEAYVVEGLQDGYFAVITKTHHAAIDGVSGAELIVNLLDLSAEVREVPPPEKPWEPDHVPSDFEMVGYALSSLSRQPISAVKAVRRTMEMALNLRERNRQPGVSPPPSPFRCPKTSLNVTVGPRRKASFVDVSLDDLKLIKNTFGGTVNDVVMALTSGALRRYLESKGEIPESPLVAFVPISVRTEDNMGSLGNKVSGMLATLASDIEDPVERLHAISDGVLQAKEQDKAIGATTLTDWAEFAAPAIAARAARLIADMKVFERLKPIFNVLISNVPGPNFPLYSAGSRLVAMYPMGPVSNGAALNITVMSYMGRMNFGLMACADALHDVDRIGGYLLDSLAELKKAAEKVNGKTADAAESIETEAVATVTGSADEHAKRSPASTTRARRSPSISGASRSGTTPARKLPAKGKTAR